MKKIGLILFFISAGFSLFGQWSSNPDEGVKITDRPGLNYDLKTEESKGKIFNFFISRPGLFSEGKLYYCAINGNGELFFKDSRLTDLDGTFVENINDIIPDGEGGVFVLYNTNYAGDFKTPELRIQRINKDGEKLFGSNGIKLSNGGKFETAGKMLLTNEDDLIIAWSEKDAGETKVIAYIEKFKKNMEAFWSRIIHENNQLKLQSTLVGAIFENKGTNKILIQTTNTFSAYDEANDVFINKFIQGFQWYDKNGNAQIGNGGKFIKTDDDPKVNYYNFQGYNPQQNIVLSKNNEFEAPFVKFNSEEDPFPNSGSLHIICLDDQGNATCGESGKTVYDTKAGNLSFDYSISGSARGTIRFWLEKLVGANSGTFFISLLNPTEDLENKLNLKVENVKGCSWAQGNESRFCITCQTKDDEMIYNEVEMTEEDFYLQISGWKKLGEDSPPRINPRCVKAPAENPGPDDTREPDYILFWEEPDGKIYASKIIGDGILPVKFTGFSARLSGNNVQLEWRTALEQNTREFVIERSVDGRNFSGITSVPSKRNFSGSGYSYLDDLSKIHLAGLKTFYYRLKSVDHDEAYELSKVVKVSISASPSRIVLHGNPVQANLQVAAWSDYPCIMKFSIFNTEGKLLKSHSVSLTHGSNNISIPVAHLPKGAYYLQATSKEINQTSKWVKQ